MSEPLCIIGAAGFLGGRALRQAQTRGEAELRVLVHSRKVESLAGAQVIDGDAGERESLKRLLTPGALVLNFAYGGETAAERLAHALGEACADRGVHRLVHVSSCAVYGRTTGRVIDESTPCRPVTPYERAKYRVEETLEAHAAGRYELAILRPTAVFGPGGKNLETIAMRVLHQPWPRRYVRACAMGRRRMHAVDVDRVAAAALFLGSLTLANPAERFIVSQDDEPANDYASIEAFFVRQFGARRYPVPPISVPAPLLRTALRVAGRTITEPQLRYSAAKLAARGFPARRDFAEGLREYADWIQRKGAR